MYRLILGLRRKLVLHGHIAYRVDWVLGNNVIIITWIFHLRTLCMHLRT